MHIDGKAECEGNGAAGRHLVFYSARNRTDGLCLQSIEALRSGRPTLASDADPLQDNTH